MVINDVAVVGGGPSGLYASSMLARAGHSVELYEEHADVGEPVHCTGVLAREVFGEFGLSADPILNELITVRFFAPSGDTVEYTTPTVEAVVIDRLLFDRQLAGQAADAGVRLRRGRVTAVEIDRDGVTVTAGGSTSRARVCLLACGASYAFQRRLGLGVPRLLLQSAQAEVPAERLGEVEVHFGVDVAPRGFAWAVPVVRSGRACVRVGVMCDRDAAGNFSRLLSRIAPRWGIRDASSIAPRQRVLPLGPIGRTYGDRLLALGDAAGLVKPTTGGGIYYGLLSAKIAADLLVRALPADQLHAAALSAYETGWRKRLGQELRWQLVFRRIAQRLPDVRIDAIFELARTDGIMPIVRRTAAFNRHREFIVALLKHPPARRVLFKAVLG
jgi:digeranylgeranylglycerophospholipid reductase